MKTKKTTIILIPTFIALISFSSFLLLARAGNLEPTAAPGPTMKTLDEVEPRIPIPASLAPTAVFDISSSGSYYLAGDRYCSARGILVRADNVTIDLMGYSLIGPDSGMDNGIYIQTGTNVEIRNGTIRDFGYRGIEGGSTGVKNIRMIGLRIISNGDVGIYMRGVEGLVKDCTVSENVSDGIVTERAYIISGCSVRQNGGRGIYAGHGNTVIDNTVYYNTDDGIETGNACVISHNTVLDNSGNYGIHVGTACTVTHNSQQNSQSGYMIGNGSTVIGNVANANERYGFYIFRSVVDQNTAYDNNQVGGYVNMYTSNCTLGTNYAP